MRWEEGYGVVDCAGCEDMVYGTVMFATFFLEVAASFGTYLVVT